MRLRWIVWMLLAVALAAPPGGSTAPPPTVARVVDGDTIELAGGQRVRLLQIDAPELGSGECYSRAARKQLAALLPVGTPVRLEADPPLDLVDSYGRLLRYVFRGGTNVNLELVRRGAVTVWFFHGRRGRYARELLRAALAARRTELGLWRACPAAPFDPLRPAATSGSGRGSSGGSDKDCSDFSTQAEAEAYFLARGGPARDPDHLDGDHDGIACETLP